MRLTIVRNTFSRIASISKRCKISSTLGSSMSWIKTQTASQWRFQPCLLFHPPTQCPPSPTDAHYPLLNPVLEGLQMVSNTNDGWMPYWWMVIRNRLLDTKMFLHVFPSKGTRRHWKMAIVAFWEPGLIGSQFYWRKKPSCWWRLARILRIAKLQESL